MAVKSKKEVSKKSETSKGSAVSANRKSVKKTTPKKADVMSEISMEKSETAVNRNTSSKSNKRLILFALLLALAGGLYLARSLFVVALVNGSPITRLEVIKELEKSSGSQVLDNFVTKKLIMQELKNRNISVSDEEVSTEIENIKKSLEGQGAKLEQLLAEQGQTMDSLRENVKIQKGIEKIFEKDIAVSDEEVKNYFDENKTAFADKTFDELKEDIKKQLFSQKLSSKYTEWISKIKSDAKVQYFVKY